VPSVAADRPGSGHDRTDCETGHVRSVAASKFSRTLGESLFGRSWHLVLAHSATYRRDRLVIAAVRRQRLAPLRTISTCRLPEAETDQPLAPLEDRRVGAIAGGHLAGVGLDLMLALLAPHDEPDLG